MPSGLVALLVGVVLVVGPLILVARHLKAALSTSSDAAGLAATCVTPAPARSGSPAHCPSAPATPPATAAHANCEIIVPARPLSAAGLATPYQLTGPDGQTPEASGCSQANAANLGAFVQATILDPATGALWVYEPLVITRGTAPAIAPIVPRLPAGAVVTIDFGFNGTSLVQAGATPRALSQGRCVDGVPGSSFGQVSFCNGAAFFRAARRAARRGRLRVPFAGVSPLTHTACPTTRDFRLVDQDPSDNVTTKYLLTATRQTAQFNYANVHALPGATDIGNGSDNALLDGFIDPVLGCPLRGAGPVAGPRARHVAGPGRALRGQESGCACRPGAGER